MLAKYKNIIILTMSFLPDKVTGTIAGVEFEADIQTDNNNQQYILVDGNTYYLSQFKVI